MSETPAAAHAARRPGHSRLVRKLAVIFLVFALVAVALNCILTYVNTRTAYLEAQTERLRQVGTYAVSSMSGSAVDAQAYWDVWADQADSYDPTSTYDEYAAYTNDLYERYAAAFERYAEKYEEYTSGSDGAEPTAEQEAELAELNREQLALGEEYGAAADLLVYYSLVSMADRIKEVFDVELLSVLIADPSSETVTYVVDGASGEGVSAEGDGDAAQGRAHLMLDTESRPRAEYPLLWEAAETGEPSPTVEVSPDGSLYSVYVPIGSSGGDRWIVQLSILTSTFNEGVIAQMVSTLVVSCTVFAVCLVALLGFLRATLAKPLFELAGRVREYAERKSPEVAGSIRGYRYPKDEIGGLAASTADMIDELQEHMTDIVRLSAERERIQSELAVAGRIQVSALPEVRPPFIGGGDFGLAAAMHPAKEVGGDFYDFFLVDEDHCGVVIADVSGKGVPAALFMMRAKTLLKQLMCEGLSPAEVLARANDNLCADNEENMFVTVWVGVLDLRSGALSFANGGHNRPLYRHADGSVEWVPERSGLILGTFGGVRYKGFERTMAPGDALLLYTDGVTEAMDTENRCYGDDRLFALLEGAMTSTPDGLASLVEGSVRTFAEGAEQADDITLLVLHFDGERGTAAGLVG